MLAAAPARAHMLSKWPTLLVLALAELLAMAVWFSASAVIPTLTDVWDLTASGQAWLTMSVQIGFVVGALGSAILVLADRVTTHRLFALSALLAALATALIPMLARGLLPALVLRFLTGLFLAGVYPVGMKIMTTWTKADRGVGIGLLVGALTVGTASPHLLKVIGGTGDWQRVQWLAAVSALAGAALAAAYVREGPFASPAAPFNMRYVGVALRSRDLMLANLGYLGHMWEIYAMWTWLPVFLLASFALRGIDAKWASVTAFAAIASGGPASLLAGRLADRVGRTVVTSAAMLMSGTCALVIGQLFGGPPWVLVLVALVWGFTVVADSAQFSACISELADRQYVGTALTLQTSMGFLLTLVSIRLLPTVEAAVGWRWAFAYLAAGPVIGIWAMATLRQCAVAAKLAGGRG